MKTISSLSTCLIFTFLFAQTCTAQDMPRLNTSVASSQGNVGVPTLKDEIEFEKVKLLSYETALNGSKETQLPLICFVGCNVDDITLFLTLKGKVILCYLQSNASPFTEINIGVVVGLWKQGQCKRFDVSPYTFSDEKFRDAFLFPSKVNINPSKVNISPSKTINSPISLNPIINSPTSTFRIVDCVGST